jgi:hypothetical protein
MRPPIAFPAGMTDIDRVDERVSHQAADEADDTVGGEHAGGRIGVTGRLGALHVVHGLDQVVNPERDRSHEDHAKEFEAGGHVADGRDRHREAEIRERATQALQAQSAVAEAEQVGPPGDDHADSDGDEPGRNTFRIFETSEPAHQDDREAGEPDDRRHVHFERRPHGDERDGDTGERSEQRRARGDLADIGSDKAADHQDEALKEHPYQAGFPAFDRIVGLKGDRQHDHESHDEHVRHAHTRGQRAHVAATGLERQAVGQKCVVHGREAHHQTERRQDAAEDERVRHLQHETQKAREHEHVHENVGAKSEKRVPVPGRPQSRTFHLGRDRRHEALLSINGSIRLVFGACA